MTAEARIAHARMHERMMRECKVRTLIKSVSARLNIAVATLK